MARHDYICKQCGWIATDVIRTAAEGARSRPPICFHCDSAMDWLPKAKFDLRGDGDSPTFSKFSMYDGQNKQVEIDSLHKLRQIERQSEQQARNGEGQPIVFRAYAQNRSNRDVHSIMADPSQKPSPEAKRRFGLQGGMTLSQAAPDTNFGPAVNEGNCSALPMDPK